MFPPYSRGKGNPLARAKGGAAKISGKDRGTIVKREIAGLKEMEVQQSSEGGENLEFRQRQKIQYAGEQGSRLGTAMREIKVEISLCTRFYLRENAR